MAWGPENACRLQRSAIADSGTTICLNQEEGHAEAGKIIRFIDGISIVVFHCFTCCKTFFAIGCNNMCA